METRMVFRLTRWALLAAAVLTGIAMILYPGGTFLRPASPGYSFFENSLSDLGSTVAWSGEANRGSPFHLAASLILVLAGCACVLGLIRVYSSSLIPRRLARGAGIIVLLAGTALLGAALTPQNRYPALHGRFTLLAVGSFPVATVLLGLATALDGRLRRRVTICWFVLTSIVVAWTSVMLSARPTTDLQMAIPVTLQKLVALTLVGTLVFQSYEAERVAATDTTAPVNGWGAR
jgi:hypothetical membrane protein